MRLVHLAPLAAIALIAAACSSGGVSSAPATAGSVESDGASAAATRIEVNLTDGLKIEPAAMTVPAGVPVTFVVTNSGTILHEFVLGDEAEQTLHEAEMAAAGGMSMPKDEEMAVGVEPGRTKELTVTFDEAGTVLAGCHVVGHYAAGMKAAVTIE
jgi:uncharacterized cupredoxin-like copper-binding protein